jgi:hypothetical protein
MCGIRLRRIVIDCDGKLAIDIFLYIARCAGRSGHQLILLMQSHCHDDQHVNGCENERADGHCDHQLKKRESPYLADEFGG